MGWASLASHLQSIQLPVYPAGMLIPPFVATLASSVADIIQEKAIDTKRAPAANGKVRDAEPERSDALVEIKDAGRSDR